MGVDEDWEIAQDATKVQPPRPQNKEKTATAAARQQQQLPQLIMCDFNAFVINSSICWTVLTSKLAPLMSMRALHLVLY